MCRSTALTKLVGICPFTLSAFKSLEGNVSLSSISLLKISILLIIELRQMNSTNLMLNSTAKKKRRKETLGELSNK